ncbi:MAG: acyloxyacyl hydrolase [Alphaproteobacteria bacterium]|nr:acyloxyacyl hydrolase [Alphaproteobacteria bacterium]
MHKSALFFLIFCLFAGVAGADLSPVAPAARSPSGEGWLAKGENIMFGDRKNAFSLDVTHDFTDGYAQNVWNFQLNYSQPNMIFRLQGRRSLHLLYITGKTKGAAPLERLRLYDYDIEKNANVSQFGVGISQDAVVWNPGRFYFGGGVGPYVKEYKNDFISAQFMFGIRGFAGYSFGRVNAELIYLHFSDGHLSELNRGMNTFGLNMSYSF